MKSERSKEEYNNIERAYQNHSVINSSTMNKIQEIFFDNMKQIFNSYNKFFEQIEKEKRTQLSEINQLLEKPNVNIYS